MTVLARKKPLNFAFNPGKSAAEHVLGLDKRKAPAVIGKAVKASGPGAKVSFGTFEVDAKTLILTTENGLPAMAKKVKAFLKLNKVKLNVVVQDPNGVVLDQDIEDLPDDDEQDASPDDAPVATNAEATAQQKLSQKHAALAAQTATLPEGATQSKLEHHLAQLEQMIAAGELKAAVILALNLQAALAKLSAPKNPAPDPQQPKADTADLGDLTRRLKALPAQIGATSDPDLKQQMIRDMKQIVAIVQAKDAAKAAPLLDALEATMGSPKQAGTAKLLPRWQAARETVDSQIAQLQGLLQGHGSSLFARIADKGLNGITRNHLVPLQAGLMDFDRTAPQDREAATKTLRTAIASMRSFLDQDRGVALLEANPLKVDITLRQTFGAALDEITGELPG